MSAKALAIVSGVPQATDHYLYPANDVHLTVANLDGSHVDPSKLSEACATAARSITPFPVELRGIRMTKYSVYLQAWDTAGSLQQLRDAVAEETGIQLALPRRLLGFVNLMRFESGDVRELSDGLARWRNVPIGMFEAQEFQIVRTDKVLSSGATEILGTVRLHGA
ncbi:MAG: 2'-5' RNA ligase family protein [Ancrocorticia sp.]